MLINLSVESFKSIGKETSISMVPGRSRSLQDHILDGDVLKTCAIFGENGSGKSTIVQSLNYLKDSIQRKRRESGKCLLKDNPNGTMTVIDMVIACSDDPIDRIIRSPGMTVISDGNGPKKDHIYRYRVGIGPSEVMSEKVWYLEGTHEHLIFDSDREKETLTRFKELPEEEQMDCDIRASKLGSELVKRIRRMNELTAMKNKAVSEGIINLETGIITRNYVGRFKDIDTEIETTRSEYEDIKREYNSNEEKRYTNLRKPRRSDGKLLIPTNSESFEIKTGPELTEVEGDAKRAIRRWIVNTLKVVDTQGYILESLDSDELRKLSTIIARFDIGIDGVIWEEITEPSEVWTIVSEFDAESRMKTRIPGVSHVIDTSYTTSTPRGIFKVVCHDGSNSLYQLKTVHRNGDRFPLNMESDGTRRVIELASVLLPSERDHVYVIDELDYRLHPVLIKKFLKMFYACESRGRKQLIFTTHETNLMSRDMFRLDEIWLAEQDEDGSSGYYCVGDMGKRITKRLDDLYLKDRILGGVPEIRDP